MNDQLLAIIDDEVHFRSMEPVLTILKERGIGFSVFPNPSFSLKAGSIAESAVIDMATAQATEWNYILSANPVDKDRFRGKVISIAHGVMFGNNAWSLNRAFNADVYCGYSPQELNYLSHHLGKRFDPSKFVATGTPLADALDAEVKRIAASGGAARRERKSALGLDPDRKTILLASHWTSTGNLRVFGGALIDAIRYNYPDCQIVVTAHPKLWSSPKNEFFIDRIRPTKSFDSAWLRTMLRDREKAGQVKLLLDESPREFIYVADIFVGDYSSVMVEAAAFDIPLVTRCEGLIFDKQVHKLIRSASHEFTNLEQLIAAIARCRAMADDRKQGRAGLREVFLYNAGHASARISEVIAGLLAR